MELEFTEELAKEMFGEEYDTCVTSVSLSDLKQTILENIEGAYSHSYYKFFRSQLWSDGDIEEPATKYYVSLLRNKWSKTERLNILLYWIWEDRKIFEVTIEDNLT